MLEVRWYYRPAEIPPNLYHLLIEDRYHENREFYLEILNPFNIIRYCPFLFFSCSFIHLLCVMMPVVMAASVNVYINHCIMCIVKCHSCFALSFFHMRRVGEDFLIIKKKEKR